MGYEDYGAGYGGLIALILGVALLPAIIVYVLLALGLMKVFQKAGVEGAWRAWVPVYNVMVFYKLGDVNPWLAFFWFGLLIPYLNGLVGLFLTAVGLLAAYRITIKLKSEGGWVALAATVAPVWILIMGFGQSRWNPNVPVAGWAANSFLADRTVWEGIPVQASAASGPGIPGYGAPQGYASTQGYQPQQPYGTQPPEPGSVPPAPPTTPPAPPAPPTAPPTPPSAPTDPNQPPA